MTRRCSSRLRQGARATFRLPADGVAGPKTRAKPGTSAVSARTQSDRDLLTQRLTVHEQTAWMLRSLLEE